MINKRLRKLFSLLGVSLVTLSISPYSFSSDFSLPFYNASELGNTYAGWAAYANDASTSYTNPAGLSRITNPQFIASAISVQGSVPFVGTASTPVASVTGKTNGSAGGFAPMLYLSAPVFNNKNIVLGFSENVPFGLGTDYAKTSLVRYAATRTQAVDLDLSPSAGFKINDQFSVGIGLDVQRITITLNHMFGPPLAIPDFEGQNHLNGWGVGYHAGVLYQFIPSTRVGVSFNSQSVFHTTGDSILFTPISEIRTTSQKINITLPARAQASLYHDLNRCWALMGSVLYTHWSTLQQVILQNTVTPIGVIPVIIPFQYHDTFDYAVGANFAPNNQWILRAGVQFLNAPSNARDRAPNDPTGKMRLVGIGTHYQQNKCIGYDLSYAHNFFGRTTINYVTPLASVIGHSHPSSDVFGAQLTWNIV
ncbi:hypothetical protein AYO45_02150 [Gammaproteobacteria bacterium SCGC AG-212-F23]|nr:hypothetical protein AYO45_02150 [Gammaproteobacteria bacterium SCGC AG-212-F23]